MSDGSRSIHIRKRFKLKFLVVLQILVSETIDVERGLRMEGDSFFSSLSHKGILTICIYDSCSEKSFTQLTDLPGGRQVEVKTDNPTKIVFYDDKMILLIWKIPLKELNVEDVFRTQNFLRFKRTEECGLCGSHVRQFSSPCNKNIMLWDNTKYLL